MKYRIKAITSLFGRLRHKLDCLLFVVVEKINFLDNLIRINLFMKAEMSVKAMSALPEQTGAVGRALVQLSHHKLTIYNGLH